MKPQGARCIFHSNRRNTYRNSRSFQIEPSFTVQPFDSLPIDLSERRVERNASDLGATTSTRPPAFFLKRPIIFSLPCVGISDRPAHFDISLSQETQKEIIIDSLKCILSNAPDVPSNKQKANRKIFNLAKSRW